MQYALLVAALAQILPAAAFAAKSDTEAASAKVCEDCPDPAGRSGWVEVGISSQSDDSYHFGRYTGQQDEGAELILNAAASYRGSLDGAYLDGEVENLGLDSRRISAEGGRQGKYEIAVEFDELPNYRKDLARASLQTERQRSGVKFRLLPGSSWEVSGHYRHEEKEGVRDVGAVFGFNNPDILAVPVNSQTDDFGLALEYQGERLQARVAYAGSLFDNDRNSIDWNNAGFGPAAGQIAESPDNEMHQLSAQLGYQVSPLTRIGASFASGRMTQDQSFLPYGVGVATALPAANLDGEVKTTLAKFNINSRPLPRLRLDASYTYSERDNTTPINTYVYLLTDSSISPGSRLNRPYSFEQNLLRLKAGYRLPGGADLSGGFDQDEMQRTYQQAEETKDQTLWAKLKLRPMADLETTFKVSLADRDASAYDATAYQNPESPLIKAFEMADRKRDKIGIDVAYNAGENLSVSLDLNYYKDKYQNMVLGLTEASGFSATPTLSYSLNEKLTTSVFYTYDRLESEQAGQEWNTVTPDVADWFASDTNRTHTVGLNLTRKAVTDKLDVSADLVYADFTGKMRYASGGNLPDLTSTLTALGVQGIYRLKENMSVRVGYRFEKYRESDWSNVNLGTVNSLGLAPQDQEIHLIYAALRYTFK
jgi:MtrB/PioB family decaheme-associated outer membrane protein